MSSKPFIPQFSSDNTYVRKKDAKQSTLDKRIETAIARNKEINQRALIYIAGFIALCSLGIGFLTYKGNRSDIYEYVQGLSDNANFLGMLIVAASGAFFAYRFAHPTRGPREPRRNLLLRALVVIIGLVAYILPGIILLLILFLSWRTTIGVTRHANGVPKLKTVNYLLAIPGFIIGIIPGIIWTGIITYPLSERACSLSGSKYC